MVIRSCVSGCALLLVAQSVLAQTYPSRPIRYIVGQVPGGSSDTLARLIAQRVSDHLGQPIVVDNRPGATGIMR